MRPQGSYPALQGKALPSKPPAEGRRGGGASPGGQRGAGSRFPSEIAHMRNWPLSEHPSTYLYSSAFVSSFILCSPQIF